MTFCVACLVCAEVWAPTVLTFLGVFDMSLPSLLVPMFAFGQYTGNSSENQSYQVTVKGFTLDVPVSKDEFDNPPQYGQHGVVTGFMKTADSNGRVFMEHPSFKPITDEKDWPSDGIETRFQGNITVSKRIWGDDPNKKYYLNLNAGGFVYSAEVDQDVFDRFPSGDHVVMGALIPDQQYNDQYHTKRTTWKCKPMRVLKPSKDK